MRAVPSCPPRPARPRPAMSHGASYELRRHRVETIFLFVARLLAFAALPSLLDPPDHLEGFACLLLPELLAEAGLSLTVWAALRGAHPDQAVTLEGLVELRREGLIARAHPAFDAHRFDRAVQVQCGGMGHRKAGSQEEDLRLWVAEEEGMRRWTDALCRMMKPLPDPNPPPPPPCAPSRQIVRRRHAEASGLPTAAGADGEWRSWLRPAGEYSVYLLGTLGAIVALGWLLEWSEA
jgi:hypothetical protein